MKKGRTRRLLRRRLILAGLVTAAIVLITMREDAGHNRASVMKGVKQFVIPGDSASWRAD